MNHAGPTPAPPLPTQRKLLGWLLLTISWVLRLVGAYGFFGAIQNVRVVAMHAYSPYFHSIPEYVRFPLILVAMAASGAIFWVGVRTGRHAHLHLANVLTDMSSLIPGGYVLYLRTFSEDQNTARISSSPMDTSASAFRLIFRTGRTYEEQLRRMFRKSGPLVAVGRPGELLPGGSGARRTFLSQDDWKDKVRDMMDLARLVLITAGPGDSTVWEYVETLRRLPPSRIVILITDLDGYKRFKAASHHDTQGVLHEIRAKRGAHWDTPVLPELIPPIPPGARNAFLKGLIYFGADWEPHLVRFKTDNILSIVRYINRRLLARLEDAPNSP